MLVCILNSGHLIVVRLLISFPTVFEGSPIFTPGVDQNQNRRQSFENQRPIFSPFFFSDIFPYKQLAEKMEEKLEEKIGGEFLVDGPG